MKIKKRQKFFGGQGQLWKAKQTRLYTAADSGRMAAKQPSASTYSMAMPCSCINHALHMHSSFYSLTYVSLHCHALVMDWSLHSLTDVRNIKSIDFRNGFEDQYWAVDESLPEGWKVKLSMVVDESLPEGWKVPKENLFFSIDPFPKTCIRQHIINDHIDLETFSFDEFNLQFRCKGVEKFYAYRQRAFKVLPK